LNASATPAASRAADPLAASRSARLLLTGAAGGLGRVLRPRLRAWTDALRISDVAALEPAAPGEELVPCDLADKAAVTSLLRGVQHVVHLGGISIDGPFEPILATNIAGLHHLYEAARQHGVRRIVFASSNHVIGFYPQGQQIDADAPIRADGNYGISKAFGEVLSRFYFDRYGIETVCLRIGSSFPEPKDRRMLTTWLSYDDLTELVRRSLFTPNVGHTIVYGASANRDSWWNNDKARHLGFAPRDSSEPWRAAIEVASPADPNDPAQRYQGGAFVTKGPYDR
jgi:uronate dehydrogenase